MKKKKIYHTVRTVPKSNRKIVDRGKIKIPNTHMPVCSLSYLGTGTSIKSGGANIVLWTQTFKLSLLSEMMRSCLNTKTLAIQIVRSVCEYISCNHGNLAHNKITWSLYPVILYVTFVNHISSVIFSILTSRLWCRSLVRSNRVVFADSPLSIKK